MRCKDGEQARLFGAFNLKIDMANVTILAISFGLLAGVCDLG